MDSKEPDDIEGRNGFRLLYLSSHNGNMIDGIEETDPDRDEKINELKQNVKFHFKGGVELKRTTWIAIDHWFVVDLEHLRPFEAGTLMADWQLQEESYETLMRTIEMRGYDHQAIITWIQTPNVHSVGIVPLRSKPAFDIRDFPRLPRFQIKVPPRTLGPRNCWERQNLLRSGVLTSQPQENRQLPNPVRIGRKTL
jgi:hypothetical protein